jgi:3-oxoacyl-[acyl-carrier protein] reductase
VFSAAFHATKGNPAYNASKCGAAALTRTLGQAWAPEGVRVNGIAPGFIETKMTAVTIGDSERRAAAEARIPLGRIGTADEMAGIAMFLASPLAGYLVGQTVLADGGMLL